MSNQPKLSLDQEIKNVNTSSLPLPQLDAAWIAFTGSATRVGVSARRDGQVRGATREPVIRAVISTASATTGPACACKAGMEGTALYVSRYTAAGFVSVSYVRQVCGVNVQFNGTVICNQIFSTFILVSIIFFYHLYHYQLNHSSGLV